MLSMASAVSSSVARLSCSSATVTATVGVVCTSATYISGGAGAGAVMAVKSVPFPISTTRLSGNAAANAPLSLIKNFRLCFPPRRPVVAATLRIPTRSCLLLPCRGVAKVCFVNCFPARSKELYSKPTLTGVCAESLAATTLFTATVLGVDGPTSAAAAAAPAVAGTELASEPGLAEPCKKNGCGTKGWFGSSSPLPVAAAVVDVVVLSGALEDKMRAAGGRAGMVAGAMRDAADCLCGPFEHDDVINKAQASVREVDWCLHHHVCRPR